jgi:hypothetical protein
MPARCGTLSSIWKRTTTRIDTLKKGMVGRGLNSGSEALGLATKQEKEAMNSGKASY